MASSQKKYYISDLHFMSALDIDSIKPDNLEIIQAINNKVSYNDKLYILGDLTSSSSNPLGLLVKLLPLIVCKNIYVIQGNHDEPRVLDALVEMKLIKNWTPACKLVKDEAFGAEISLGLSHYPIVDFYAVPETTANLHGHTHNNCFIKLPHMFDVSLEAYKEPVTFEELLSKKYGYNANPLSEYEAYNRAFTREYENLCKTMDAVWL